MQNVNLTSYFLLLVLQLDWVTYTPTESSLRDFFANGKAHPKAAAQKGNFTYYFLLLGLQLNWISFTLADR